MKVATLYLSLKQSHVFTWHFLSSSLVIRVLGC